MYYVVVKAVITAVNGPEVAWGKLERQATVAFDAGPSDPRLAKGGPDAGPEPAAA
jgi:hypothetical protein